MMTATPMTAPMPIMLQGRWPPNMPLATDAMRLACARLAAECGCSAVRRADAVAVASRFSVGAMTSAQEIEPMASMTCWRHGVAPTR